MSQITRVTVTFPIPVEMPEAAHRALHDAVEITCASYERAHPDRVMWAAGEGGTPPPGFFFDEPQGEWDMSALNIDVAERERHDTDRGFKLSASAELRAHIEDEIARLERALPRKREMAAMDDPELRMGGATFVRKYERDLRVLRLAQQALGMCPASAQAPSGSQGDGP